MRGHLPIERVWTQPKNGETTLHEKWVFYLLRSGFSPFFWFPHFCKFPPQLPRLTLVPAQAVRRTLCRPLTINSAVTSVTGLLLGPLFCIGSRVKQACRQLYSGLSGRHQRYDLGPMYPQRHVPPSTLSTGKRPRNLAYVVIHMWP